MAMKMRISAILASLLAGGIVAICATGAAAADLVMTFKGTATSITDSTDLFHLTPGTTSAEFVDKFTFNLNIPGSYASPHQIYGGAGFGTQSPLISSAITINGQTVKFKGGYADQAYYGSFTQGTGVQGFLGFGPVVPPYFNELVLYTNNPPANLNTPYSALGTGDGSFFICPSLNNCNYGTNTVAGFLAPTSYVATISAAPEPATWAMMLVGFGAVGCALRAARRRSNLGQAQFPARRLLRIQS